MKNPKAYWLTWAEMWSKFFDEEGDPHAELRMWQALFEWVQL